jgi:hypothetical protein
MEKKTFQYKLTLEALKDPQGETIEKSPLEFEFQNHDNIFKIIEIIKDKNLFANPDECAEFAIGLKLFGKVMMYNRDLPLFEEMLPVFGQFMKRLKGK